MGLDIDVLAADWDWLGEAPRDERLERLRDAWYADAADLWHGEVPEGVWCDARGGRFAVYEFRRTAGSFKAHFWAGERWEAVRDHADPAVRAALDTLLSGLVWLGPDGEAEQVDPGFFSPDPAIAYGLLLARSPESVRELAALWDAVRPRLGGLRDAFDTYAARPGRWVGEFGEFTMLLEDWGRVLAGAARRGWGVVGLSE